MQQLLLTGSPHIRSSNSTSRIMLDVIIALIPALVAGCIFFGSQALLTVALATGAAVGCEALIEKVSGREVTINDLSAVVTGLLLGLNLPPEVPWYIPVCGSAFAIIIAKQLFGGIGHNFINPALAGRCFLLISWPVAMTAFALPIGVAPDVYTTATGVEGISTATPLVALAQGAHMPELSDLFLGSVRGCIGETSALALLIGGAYLLIRRVINYRIPVAYLATVAVFVLFTGHPEYVAYNLFAGGLMLGAFFMATDYVSSPSTPLAQVIFGCGCGVVTMVIRQWGSYPEGVSFSILFMNLFAPLLDSKLVPKIYGEVKKVEEK